MRANSKISITELELLQGFDAERIIELYRKSKTERVSVLDLARAVGRLVYVHNLAISVAGERFGENRAWATRCLDVFKVHPRVIELMDFKRPAQNRISFHDLRTLCSMPFDRQYEGACNLLRVRSRRRQSYVPFLSSRRRRGVFAPA